MDKDKETFERYHGPIDTPLMHAQYCDFVARRTGRTTVLIESIPNKPIIILVHDYRYVAPLKHQIRELRPDYDIKNIVFVSWGGDCMDQLRGLRNREIWIDNAVYDSVMLRFCKDFNEIHQEISGNLAKL